MEGQKIIGAPPGRGSSQEDAHLSSASTSQSADQLGIESVNPGEASAVYRKNVSAFTSNQALFTLSNSISLDHDDSAMLTDDDPGFTRSSSTSRRQSTASSTTNNPQRRASHGTSPDDDVIEVNSNAFQLPLDPTSRGKLKNRYIMPDGTVINGKGLGRGRPGVKRGPRKSALSREVTEGSTDAAAPVSTPSPVSQAKTTTGKRKRKDSDVIKAEDEDEDEEDEDYDADDISRDSTPEYNPAAATHTRSGRQSQKPAPLVTPATSIASPSMKRPPATQSTSSPSIKKHPKIKPKVYRGREQFALCEHCLRQHGPPGNVIVFCDACNKCWHQRCHDPKISKEVVEDTKAQWFCMDCDRILHPKRKNKPLPKPTPQLAQSASPITATPNITPAPAKVVPRYGLPLIPGMSLTMVQRKEYLNSISKEKLVEIVLQAANLAPNMPIFETPLHLAPQFLPGQPYPIFMQLATLGSSRPQTESHSLSPPAPQSQPQINDPINDTNLTPTPPPTNVKVNIASMPPPPPPSQLPAHLRAQFTSSMATGASDLPLQPVSSSSSALAASSIFSTSSSPSTPALAPAVTPTLTPNTPTPYSIGSPKRTPIYTHPTAHITTKPNTAPPPISRPTGSDADADDDDEGYYDDFDELALLYPRPGQGAYDLAIAPESSDMGIMLEGADCATFSHVVY